MAKEYRVRISRPEPLWVSIPIAVGLVAFMAWLRLFLLPHRIIPIGYGVPLIVFVWLRDRRILWITAACFAIISVIKFMRMPPGVENIRVDSVFLLVDLVVITAVVHTVITVRSRITHGYVKLESAHSELAQREEEITRQNEELQSQTEELERQSEELRIANEEMAQREKLMEVLLDLSRSLRVGLTDEDMLERICETLGQLVDGMNATAILLADPD